MLEKVRDKLLERLSEEDRERLLARAKEAAAALEEAGEGLPPSVWIAALPILEGRAPAPAGSGDPWM